MVASSQSTGFAYGVSSDGLVRIAGTQVLLLELPFPDLACALKEGGLAILEAARVRAECDMRALQLVAPFASARKVIVVGLNHATDSQERLRRRSGEPTLFVAPGSAIAGPFATVSLPAAAGELILPEGEVGLVIGTYASELSIPQAWGCIAGLTLVNDLTAVDVVRRAFTDRSFNAALGKSFDGFKPAGPYLTPCASFSPDFNLEVTTRVNGQIVQRGNTCDYIFGASEIVAYVSRYMTLEPGDLICMGAPVSPELLVKQASLRVGDRVEVSVPELGALETRIVPASDSTTLDSVRSLY